MKQDNALSLSNRLDHIVTSYWPILVFVIVWTCRLVVVSSLPTLYTTLHLLKVYHFSLLQVILDHQPHPAIQDNQADHFDRVSAFQKNRLGD
jgi:hypothetical protein